MRAFTVVIGLLLVSGAAHSETDVFMRAVGFALEEATTASVAIAYQTNLRRRPSLVRSCAQPQRRRRATRH